MRQNFPVLDRLNQAEPEHRQRDPERDIMLSHLLFEIRLNETARGDRRVMLDTPHGPQLVHTAVRNRVAVAVADDVAVTVHLVDKADLADRTVLQLKARYDILLAEAVRDQVELRVLWRPGGLRTRLREIDRIGNQEAARPAQCRLRMTRETLVAIVTRAKPIGVGRELRKDRIDFLQSIDRIYDRRRSIGYHPAIVAGRFQLAGAKNPLKKQQLLVLSDSCFGRVRADQRWRRDFLALGLKPATGILQSAPHARILLR